MNAERRTVAGVADPGPGENRADTGVSDPGYSKSALSTQLSAISIQPAVPQTFDPHFPPLIAVS
jgi:hypothetical protein